jgi:phage recombination protein Bet
VTNELAVQERAEVAVQQPQDFTAEQIQLLKDTVCKGATNAELALFKQVCISKRLDPFAKQIHAVKRWDSTTNREIMSFQTGIDGYRLIAERSGKYAGQDPPMWCGPDGIWKDIWLDKNPPFAARAVVHRHGFTAPMVRVARWSAYVQTKKDGNPNQMWAKMGPEQLFKCAEAVTLRAAFPEELAGLHTREEMGQAENEEPTRAEKVQAAQDVAAEKLKQLTAPKVHDAEFVDEPPAPPQDEKPDPGKFEILKHFKAIKSEFTKLGAESRYYGVLKANGFAKSNEIKGADEGRKVYACLAAELKSVRLDIADREETQKLFDALVTKHGQDAVFAALGREGSASWDEVPVKDRDAMIAKLREALA